MRADFKGNVEDNFPLPLGGFSWRWPTGCTQVPDALALTWLLLSFLPGRSRELLPCLVFIPASDGTHGEKGLESGLPLLLLWSGPWHRGWLMRQGNSSVWFSVLASLCARTKTAAQSSVSRTATPVPSDFICVGVMALGAQI